MTRDGPDSSGDDRRIRLDRGQLEVLERIACGDSLAVVLERIVLLLESVSEGAAGSILLVDGAAGTVHHGAAPHLPEAFVRAIDGSKIGPREGSCGAAAYSKQRVVAEDLETHPNWTRYKEAALPHGLRACWSSPILDPRGEVLGTFAFYYRTRYSPTSDDLAQVEVATHLASIAIGRDRSERELRESELRYRRVYDAVVDVIFRVQREDDGRFRFVSVNPSFTRSTGLAAYEVVGKCVDEIIPPESLELVLSKYRRAIDERTSVRWEETSSYPIGVRTGDVTIAPIFDDDGQLVELVGTVHDVSERKAASERIAAQASLLDRARDSIVLLETDDDSIRYWNGGAARLYGHPADVAIGRRFSELVDVPPGERARFLEKLQRDGECTIEQRRRTATGATRIVESRATLLVDESGAPKEVLLIETDLTERRAAESHFLRSQRIESLGTLAGGVAHDFNNILTGILAHVRAASRALDADHPASRFLGEIEKASWRAAELTRRILTFSQRVDPARGQLDLRGPVAEAIALLRSTVPPPILFSASIGDDVPEVLGDSTGIHQIVMNLGTNAAHAIGKANGTIHVSLRGQRITETRTMSVGSVVPGRYAVIEVTDSGRGIEPETIEKMFEPYFTTKTTEGTGLGLSVVHGIVNGHEGAIDVESVLARGTTFRVYLPSIEHPGAERSPNPAESPAPR